MAKKNINNKVEEALDKQTLKEEKLRTGEKRRGKLNPVAEVEKQAEKEADIVSGAGDAQIAPNDQTIEAALTEGGAGTESEVPVEVEGMHTEKFKVKGQKLKVKESRNLIKGKSQKSNKKSKLDKKSPVQKSQRSKKYNQKLEKHEKGKEYSIAEAVKKVKELSYTKFDGTVELHVRLQAKKKSEDVNVRGTINLPAGSPKVRNVVIASDELIEEIAKGKINFDILLATPEMMPKLAKVAKVLGPKGKMPSPKSGTVTADPEKTKQELSSGLVEYKTDAHGNVHIAVGKVSWDDEKLVKNIETIIGVLPKRNIVNIVLTSTMSPAVKIENK